MQTVKNYLLEFKQGTKKMFKEFFNKETNKKQRANMWTFSRILIAPIVPILTIISIISSSTAFLTVALGITTFGAITDFFDGRSARKHNSTSEFGKTLDQVADKLFSTSIGISLSLLNPLFLLNILGEALITSINIVYKFKNNNIHTYSSKLGKFKQWPLSLTFIVGIISQIIPNLSLLTNILIYTTFATQLFASTDYLIKYEKENKQIKVFQKQQIIENNIEQKTPDNSNNKTETLNNQKRIEELTKIRNLLLYEINKNKSSPESNPEINLKRARKNHQY